MSSEERKKTVGFVGLGMMGGPMAENILRKGHPLVAYDIDKRKLEHFVGLGAQAGFGPGRRRAPREHGHIDGRHDRAG